MTSIDHILVGASVLLLLSVLASKASSKLGIPALLLFLALGMLAGSDGPGGIYFDDARLAQSIGVIALALILFSGGLDTEWSVVRPVLGKGLALSTIGVLITAVLVGLFARTVLGFSLLEGILLGAIVSATDAAAVFSVLRARSVGLKG
ncbi:MAG: cation:proton antiporter, partial [Blastocatellia bacterium]